MLETSILFKTPGVVQVFSIYSFDFYILRVKSPPKSQSLHCATAPGLRIGPGVRLTIGNKLEWSSMPDRLVPQFPKTANWVSFGFAILAAFPCVAIAQMPSAQPTDCRRIVLAGEVNAGQEWKSSIGEGWVFRVVPVQAGQAGYSGWDLVVDREKPAGFPDALLVATPPYNSINEHEVATTFGLRAQDAMGWNPRSFHFLTSVTDFLESQRLYESLNSTAGVSGQSAAVARALKRLMEFERRASAGQFRILDARLTPGIGDAASYAENWALASPKTPHKFEPAATGRSTPLGELHWVRFSVTLWLPSGWKVPRELDSTKSACAE